MHEGENLSFINLLLDLDGGRRFKNDFIHYFSVAGLKCPDKNSLKK